VFSAVNDSTSTTANKTDTNINTVTRTFFHRFGAKDG